MARSYNKSSPYWQKFEQTNAALPPVAVQSWKPETAGDPFYTSSSSLLAHTAKASIGARLSQTTTDSTGQRVNAAALIGNPDRFSCIRQGLLPYRYSKDCVDIRDAIHLCQLAHANVAVFRNAISLMAEMANSPIYFDGGTKKSRDFFAAWTKKVKIGKVAEQFFLEFYRSSNVFVYRIEAPFETEDFIKLTQVYGSDGEGAGTNKIPVSYIFLNPYDIVSRAATAFSSGQYEKVLSRFELERLKNPQTDEDKQILANLPQEARDAISKKAWVADGVRVKLDPKMLITSFLSKMTYEPFAVPFGYPVLDDINAKLELKKMDQAILRTVENAILLITMGAKPEDGGINPANLTAMQNLFKNESVGRVLVSDWTTKAEFVIPDLKKVLGPEKYQILNQDIQEGLQNVLVGEEKYGNTQTKVKIFLEKLNVARNAFLNDLLQPEVQRIAKSLGMRKFPTAKFKTISADDQTQTWRVITRMMELGILSGEQALTAMRTGEFTNPDSEDFILAQKEYTKQRGQGLWNPLNPVPVQSVPAPKLDPNVKYQVDNAPAPTSTTKSGGVKKKAKAPLKAAGRPSGSKASLSTIQETIYATEELLSHIRGEIKSLHNLESLSEQQEQISQQLMQSVVCSTEKPNWHELATACVNDNSKMLDLNVRPEVLDLAAEFELPDYDAAILFESQASEII